MLLKSMMTTSAALAVVAACTVASPIPARAQSDVQAELLGFHQLCDRGDRKACVKFGMILGRMQERHAEWRRLHPEWFWWEH